MNKVTLYGKDKSGKFKQWSIWTDREITQMIDEYYIENFDNLF